MKRTFSVIAAVGLTLCAAAAGRAQQPVPRTYVLTDITANIWAGGPWINDSGQIGPASPKDGIVWVGRETKGRKGSVIEIQRDHRVVIVAELSKRGWIVKRVGE